MNVRVAATGLLPPRELEITRARPLLGTLVEIAATGRDAARVNEAIARAFEQIDRVHRLMSFHDPASDVSRINRDASASPVSVHEDTWQVLTMARDVAEVSRGLFDITIAPVLAAYEYLPCHPEFPKPSDQGDWRHVELLPGRLVRLARCLQIDLGGIAKGYAVDLAIGSLQTSGMSAGRVNAGGDLRVFGAATQTIRVRHPLDAAITVPLMRVRNGAMATSATYFSAKLQCGRWISPLIHPLSRASCGAGISVSVVAEDCMTADALTKVVHADPAGAPALLECYGASAVMLDMDPTTGGSRMTHTEGGQWRVAALSEGGDE
ncbi:MAG: FAD:protein FMN transferase [Thiobacillaceae bacterium]